MSTWECICAVIAVLDYICAIMAAFIITHCFYLDAEIYSTIKKFFNAFPTALLVAFTVIVYFCLLRVLRVIKAEDELQNDKKVVLSHVVVLIASACESVNAIITEIRLFLDY